MKWGIAAFLLLGGLGWIARLFTAKITYKDDPSTGLVWRAAPSCERKIRATASDPPRTYLVREDDNAFAGEWLYDGLVDWATIVGPAAALGLAVYHRRSHRTAPPRAT